ncbi:MarR family winged helix-turn-helix transcriptional regulator [Thioalkalivibrio thiocyanodenitrificans]|uniref:MarR family winged helix-turn-helix transcriptional regulator n=1 Tax=Thioalkalivibrio thiocyanodenitrificans TaxID=243063 RepID=UPI00036991D4|nr:MarR family transcriptional regulator [Thioalkalivibrio thiocyanodenitrificans]
MLPTLCHCTRLRRAARLATRIYDEVLSGSGLKVTQYSLMRAVERLGEASISELAEATGLERSAAGRNLRPLERDGLVAITGSDDRRSRTVRLTAAGRKRLDGAKRRWLMAQRRLAATLGEQDLNALSGLLDRLLKHAD